MRRSLIPSFSPRAATTVTCPTLLANPRALPPSTRCVAAGTGRAGAAAAGGRLPSGALRSAVAPRSRALSACTPILTSSLPTTGTQQQGRCECVQDGRTGAGCGPCLLACLLDLLLLHSSSPSSFLSCLQLCLTAFRASALPSPTSLAFLLSLGFYRSHFWLLFPRAPLTDRRPAPRRSRLDLRPFCLSKQAF